MLTLNLKAALKKMGYEVLQYGKGYNFRSGFMTKDDVLYYFNYEDLRFTPTLLVRTANPSIKDKKGKYADYRGGRNTYPDVAALGIRIYEPRSKCDYNSM